MSLAQQLGPAFQTFIGEDSPVQIAFWDGSSIGPDDAKATARFNSVDALRHIVWAPGELGLARAYITGAIDLEGDWYYGLSSFLGKPPNPGDLRTRAAVGTIKTMLGLGVFTSGRPQIPAEETVPRGRVHTKFRDAQAISHHYDVGNDFYRLFLGSTMTYSCARFIHEHDDLDSAQVQKYDLICRKLDLQPGQRLLDVGCGWGGLVMHAAKHYGVQAVGITLSKEQAALAQERIAAAGLTDKIDIRVQDYRDVKDETFDAISSVGMFEHVGHAQAQANFTNLYAVLSEGGRFLNHAISKPHGSVMAANGFIARYVFPDGELQDVAVSNQAMEDAGFELRDVESLREHYAKTLRFWVSNLESNWDKAVEMVGETRARVWRIYMIGSAVSFERNLIAIHQSLGVRTPSDGHSGMPLTRESYV